jgi:hypothetical protein
VSVELSHRLAKVAHQPPVGYLPIKERHALWLACERAMSFSDLSEGHQQLILQAEAALERAIAAKRAAEVH